MSNKDKWERHALCRGLDVNDFVPEGKLGVDAQRAHDRAVSFCHNCPVRRQCLEFALNAEGDAPASTRFGVFGGLTPAQRHKLQVRRNGKRRQARSTVLTA